MKLDVLSIDVPNKPEITTPIEIKIKYQQDVNISEQKAPKILVILCI